MTVIDGTVHVARVFPHRPFASNAGTGGPSLNLNDFMQSVSPNNSILYIVDDEAPFSGVHPPDDLNTQRDGVHKQAKGWEQL